MAMRVLFVDDETSVLEGLQRMLRPMRHVWEMSFVTNGPEALARMTQTSMDVIVADIKMPGMDGVELLTEVKKRFPRTMRFVLSGQSDKEAIYRATSPAHQYLSKPCDSATIKSTIEHALALRSFLNNDSLKKLIAQIRILPSLPTSYVRIIQELRSPDASLQNVGAIIEQDLGMSSKILQLVNSAFFGLPHKVASPSQAVSLLGLETIRSLVLMFDVFKQFGGVNGKVPGISLEGLQRHSIAVSAYARALGKRLNLDKKVVDDLFMAGLFHDVGKLVLIANIPRQYAQVVALSRGQNMPLGKAELAVFGATHAEIGAYLLGLWGFADPVIEGTAFHHRPGMAQGPMALPVALTHIANVIDYELRGSLDGIAASKYDMEVLQKLDLAQRLPEWLAHCRTVDSSAIGV